MCVLKTAMDVFDLGIEPIVLVDCCASGGPTGAPEPAWRSSVAISVRISYG